MRMRENGVRSRDSNSTGTYGRPMRTERSFPSHPVGRVVSVVKCRVRATPSPTAQTCRHRSRPRPLRAVAEGRIAHPLTPQGQTMPAESNQVMRGMCSVCSIAQSWIATARHNTTRCYTSAITTWRQGFERIHAVQTSRRPCKSCTGPRKVAFAHTTLSCAAPQRREAGNPAAEQKLHCVRQRGPILAASLDRITPKRQKKFCAPRRGRPVGGLRIARGRGPRVAGAPPLQPTLGHAMPTRRSACRAAACEHRTQSQRDSTLVNDAGA